MTTPGSLSVSPMLTVVVLAKENTSYAFRHMLEGLKAQTIPEMNIWVLDCNVPGDPYSLSLQEDVDGMADVRLLPSGAGAVPARCNEALAQVESPYVCFVNSNDSWYPYKAERQLQELEAHPGCHACLCNGYRRLLRTDFADSSLIFTQTETAPAKWLTSTQLHLSSQVVYRTESLRAAGGFDTQLKTRLDQDALLRLCTEDTLRIITEPLFDNNTAREEDPDEDYESCRRLLRKHYDLLLRNRRQYYHMNMQLARMAARCTLWLHVPVHFYAALSKTPLYALRRAVTAAAGWVARTARNLWQELRIRQQVSRLHRSLRPLRKNEPPAAPLPDYPGIDMPPETLLDPAKHNRPFALAGNRKVCNAVIPDHMTLIPYGMFAGCSSLERVVIPPTVTHIDAYAFLGCEKLRYVELQPGSQLTHIDAYAFAGCSGLISLTLPCNINHMGAYAFAGCTSLSAIRFAYNEKGQQTEKNLYPSVLDGIAPALFAGCRSLLQVEFPEGSVLANVGSEAFLGCACLHHVYLDGPIRAIGPYAFAQCTALEGFVFPQVDGVEHIGRAAFRNCRRLTYFRLPYALKQITRRCFEGCESLKYIKIPKRVLYVEPHAFTGCRDLESVILISSNTKYPPNAFDTHTRIECT